MVTWNVDGYSLLKVELPKSRWRDKPERSGYRCYNTPLPTHLKKTPTKTQTLQILTNLKETLTKKWTLQILTSLNNLGYIQLHSRNHQ